MTRVNNTDTGKVEKKTFLERVEAGIAQAEQDAVTIAEATQLSQLKPAIAAFNNRQIEIMKALRYVAEHSPL